MTLGSIVKAIKESGCECFGIRHLTDDESYEIGEACRNSYDWDDENDCSTYETTGEELDGTCAYGTGIELWWDTDEDIEEKLQKALDGSKNAYYGDEIVVIGGNVFQNGNDENEVIIENAKVIARI